jgi:hypothetical protein
MKKESFQLFELKDPQRRKRTQNFEARIGSIQIAAGNYHVGQPLKGIDLLCLKSLITGSHTEREHG